MFHAKFQNLEFFQFLSGSVRCTGSHQSLPLRTFISAPDTSLRQRGAQSSQSSLLFCYLVNFPSKNHVVNCFWKISISPFLKTTGIVRSKSFKQFKSLFLHCFAFFCKFRNQNKLLFWENLDFHQKEPEWK